LDGTALDYFSCPEATPRPPTPAPPTEATPVPVPDTPQPPTLAPPPVTTVEPTPSPLNGAGNGGVVTKENAVLSCNLLGGWVVTDVWDGLPLDGAIICSRSPYNGGNNCNGCDSWRLYVFTDGGRDMSSNAQAYQTVAGKYYSGHMPCAAGWNLQECGSWPTPTPEPPTPAPLTQAPEVNPYNSPSCSGNCMENVCAAQSGELELLVTGSLSGSVWGTATYTTDSSVGAAAVHAGKLSPGVTKTLKIDCSGEASDFPGSSSNGVTSQSFSGAFRSFRFSDTPVNPPTIRVCFNDPCAMNQCFAPGIVLYLQVTGSTHGSIWGDNIYTDDTSVAVAAVHTGILAEGQTGTVVVSCAGAQTSFSSSERNGIASASYGPWLGSYTLTLMNSLPPSLCTGRCLSGACNSAIGQWSFYVQGTASGPAWGSGPYTADSALGVVAAHAGAVAIGEAKLVTFVCAGEHTSFAASTANHVTTADWPASWPGSITVCTTPACFNPPPLPCAGACLQALCDSKGAIHRVSVTGTASGVVFGSGPYTDDSDIASAAVHAGVLLEGETKTLEVYCAGAQESYSGSLSHSVTSTAFGAWPHSFNFKM
jgi:hypothetical protein